MENNLILIQDFCIHNHVEITFVQSLEEYGLLHTETIEKHVYIDNDELNKLERYLRLSEDLSINLAGLHAVSHLLQQLHTMEDEMTLLKNELDYYKQLR